MPTIVLNISTTSNFLDAGLGVSPNSSYSISGVKGDAGDPASNLGVDFTIGDDVTAVGSLVVTAVSSNQTVVPAANINLTGTGANRNLKITPSAVGYSDITITVTGVELEDCSKEGVEKFEVLRSVNGTGLLILTASCQ